MKKFKGTEGVWVTEYDKLNGYSVFLKEDHSMYGKCYIVRGIEQGHDGGKYDAKAISAVPEMIAALQEVDYQMKNLPVATVAKIPESMMKMLEQVRKALKKAL